MHTACSNCNSTDLHFVGQLSLIAPMSLYKKITKRNLRKASVNLLGFNWEAADIICLNCGAHVYCGAQTYIHKLEAKITSLKIKIEDMEADLEVK